MRGFSFERREGMGMKKWQLGSLGLVTSVLILLVMSSYLEYISKSEEAVVAFRERPARVVEAKRVKKTPETETVKADDVKEDAKEYPKGDLKAVVKEDVRKDIKDDVSRGGVLQVEVTKDVIAEAPKTKIDESNLNQGELVFNKYVLDIIKTYQGSYPYLLNNDFDNYNGVSEDISYQGRILLKAHPSGSRATHCVGITYEVFFKAMEQRNKDLGLPSESFRNLTADQMWDFIMMWYVASGPKAQNNCAIAIEKYGFGKRIMDLADAKPGDFIDFSRENNTGHTAVFSDWIKEGGRIIGLKYWSSQGSTQGVAYNEEYLNVLNQDGKKYGNVMQDQIYIGRVIQ